MGSRIIPLFFRRDIFAQDDLPWLQNSLHLLGEQTAWPQRSHSKTDPFRLPPAFCRAVVRRLVGSRCLWFCPDVSPDFRRWHAVSIRLRRKLAAKALRLLPARQLSDQRDGNIRSTTLARQSGQTTVLSAVAAALRIRLDPMPPSPHSPMHCGPFRPLRDKQDDLVPPNRHGLPTPHRQDRRSRRAVLDDQAKLPTAQLERGSSTDHWPFA